MRATGARLWDAIAQPFASAAQGQIVSLTAREYEKALKSAAAISEKRVRRVTTLIETKTKGRITSKSQHVEEYIPPELERFVDTTFSGGDSATEETIQIGSLGFQKKENTPWVEWTGPPFRALAPQPVSSCGTFAGELGSYGSGETKLEGHVTRFLSRNAETNMQGLVLQEVCRVLISSDGVLLKIEIETIEGDSKEWVKRIVSTWAYDPSIRIEAPIK